MIRFFRLRRLPHWLSPFRFQKPRTSGPVDKPGGDAGGISEGSRWSSEATPPDRIPGGPHPGRGASAAAPQKPTSEKKASLASAPRPPNTIVNSRF